VRKNNGRKCTTMSIEDVIALYDAKASGANRLLFLHLVGKFGGESNA
jgi:hypothetical protein